jgi:hypothetical protein
LLIGELLNQGLVKLFSRIKMGMAERLAIVIPYDGERSNFLSPVIDSPHLFRPAEWAGPIGPSGLEMICHDHYQMSLFRELECSPNTFVTAPEGITK